MSLSADTIGENAISAQATASPLTKGPPPKRTTVALTDPVVQPEPR